MISIRKGCFETNSSSMHSLAIWKKVKPYSEYELSLGTYYDNNKTVFELFDICSREPEDYEFGRYPYRQLTTPVEKLRYIVGLYIDCEYPIKEGTEDERDYEKEPTYFFTDKKVEEELTRLIKKYTQCEKIEWSFQREEMNWDHEWEVKTYCPSTSTTNDSGEDVMHFVRRKNISLEDLIFKPNYTIQVDGDEHCEFADMFKFGIINLDNLEDISSGVDYWTDNIRIFYPDQVFEEWGPEDDRKSYLEIFEENLEDGNLIEIESYDSFDKLTEEQAKVASEYLYKLKDKHKIEITEFENEVLKEKYFRWVKED